MKRLIILLLVLLGCGSGVRYYLHPTADISYVKRVAILPLHNFSRDNLAHERIRDVFETELLKLELFEVVDRGEVDAVLRELRIREPSEITPALIKKIGQRLSVQAVFTGSVDEYKTEQSGGISLAIVAISLKLIDVQSGKVIWQVSASEKGGGILNRLFGIGEKSLTEVSYTLIQKCLKTLS
ncbi:MAG: CsgG/HfaB family protein [Candidatus Desulfofervidus auxilii]|nr:CsgG/HfaB family protein [Candidatus Desulfofervidus auxilii]